MTHANLSPSLTAELKAKLQQAAKAAELLRSSATNIDSDDPDESLAELSVRLRGAAVLGHTAAHELALVSGWVDAMVSVELATE